MIIVHILISIASYFILMLLSANLLGLFVRGLFPNPDFEKLKSEGHELIKQEVRKTERAGKLVNITALILIIAYLYLLFHFWNIGVMAVAVILMIGRLPDLLWEIKHGKKIDTKFMPNNTLSFIANFLIWSALPLLYYFLYHF